MSYYEAVTTSGDVIYVEEDVQLKHLNGARKGGPYQGTLKLIIQPYGKFIAWQPASTEEKKGTDWTVLDSSAVVNFRNHDGSGVVEFSGEEDSGSKSHPLLVCLDDLKSYRLVDHTFLTLIQKDGTSNHVLTFQKGKADIFIDFLSDHLIITPSTKDDTLFLVMDPQEAALNRSFSELHLFDGKQRDYVRKFFQDFTEDPYATTMTGFSKLYDILYHGASPHGRNRSEKEVAELLQRSLSPVRITHEDGYEVVESLNMRLPPRPSVSRGPPLTSPEWKEFLDLEGRVTRVAELKQRIFRGGMEPGLRKEAWKFLLGMYPYDSTEEEREELRKKKVDDYYRMKLQWRSISAEQESRFSALRDRKALVEKDVERTDRTVHFYEGKGNDNLLMLKDILTTYIMWNFDLGYVQGMSDLLSPILFIMENEVDAFWCFVGFMDIMGPNFAMDQSKIKEDLEKAHFLVESLDPDLGEYLEKMGSGNMYFCFRWLLIWFKREFEFPDVQRLWEVLWTGLPTPNFYLLLCVAALCMEKAIIMENQFGFTEILKHVNEMSYRIDVEKLLAEAEGLYLQVQNAQNLPSRIAEILGLEISPHQLQMVHQSNKTEVNGQKSPPGAPAGAIGSSEPGNTSTDTEAMDSIEVLGECDDAISHVLAFNFL